MKICGEVNDLASATSPLIYLSKFLGLAPYARKEHVGPESRRGGQLVVSRAAQIYSFLLLLGLVVGLVFIFRILNGEHDSTAGLSNFLNRMASITNCTLAFIVLIIVNLVQPKHMVGVFNDFEFVHSLLMKNNKKLYRVVKLITFIEVITLLIGITVTIAWDLRNVLSSNDIAVLETILYISATIPRVAVTHCVNLTFLVYFYLRVLNSSFPLARKEINYFTKNEEDSKEYDPISVPIKSLNVNNRTEASKQDDGFVPKLQDIRKAYYKLSQILDKISFMYSSLIVMETFAGILNTSTILYTYISTFKPNVGHHNENGSPVTLWVVLWWLWPIASKLFLLSLCGELVSGQAHRTASLIQGALLWEHVQSQIHKEKRQQELEAFAAQLSASNGDLRAAGGLQVNLGLLAAASSAILTYLIVMLQFSPAGPATTEDGISTTESWSVFSTSLQP